MYKSNQVQFKIKFAFKINFQPLEGPKPENGTFMRFQVLALPKVENYITFCMSKTYFDLLNYSNKSRGHMQTSTAQCSGWVQETIILTESCQRPVFYKLHVTFCQDYFKKCFLSIVIISFNKTPNQCAAINQVFISNRFIVKAF